MEAHDPELRRWTNADAFFASDTLVGIADGVSAVELEGSGDLQSKFDQTRPYTTFARLLLRFTSFATNFNLWSGEDADEVRPSGEVGGQLHLHGVPSDDPKLGEADGDPRDQLAAAGAGGGPARRAG